MVHTVWPEDFLCAVIMDLSSKRLYRQGAWCNAGLASEEFPLPPLRGAWLSFILLIETIMTISRGLNIYLYRDPALIEEFRFSFP